MAQVHRHRRTIAAALLGLAALAFAPALAQDQGSNAGTDLYDRPVLAIDPNMHTAKITSQAVDAAGRFAVTGSDDRTVRVWSIASGKLLRTIWIPVGPADVGAVYAVAISPDGSTIAAGGYTERIQGDDYPIYIFDRESGNLIQRIHGDLPEVTHFLTFSPDGRYLAATLGGGKGLRVFDREKDWSETFRDGNHGDDSYGAAFARDGRLATTALDGMIRLYRFDPHNAVPGFHRIREPVKAPSGNNPYLLAFSPDGKRLAVGYLDAAAVDILDGTTLAPVGTKKPADVMVDNGPLLSKVAWSADGRTLFADGGVNDAEGRYFVFAWDRAGLGDERRMTYCASDTAAGVDALTDGRILIASRTSCLSLMDAYGKPIWTVASPVLDSREQRNVMRVSQDGQVVDFGYRGSDGAVLRFDIGLLTLSSPPLKDGLTFAPNRDGLTIGGWWNGANPTLDGRALPFTSHDIARSLAIAPDAKRFFVGSSYALTAFDDAGTQKWRWRSRNVVWAVNASRDGRVVVSADGDGAIRWHRADDGRELLALQVLPNKNADPSKWDWVLWTPEGFYEASPGAQDVLKWVVNHGPDNAATTLPVSAIPRLHRPDALPLVLQELETARALGIADLALARCDVQAAAHSAKPPGEVLHVLAIGIDKFGDRAGSLHLDYADDDARDVATALLGSQKKASCKPSLYADVKVETLTDATEEKPTRENILKAIDAMAQNMRRTGSGRDVALVLVSTHGAMIGSELYLLPYGVDLTSIGASALSVTDLARSVQALAEAGKVILLIDACHSGAIGPDKLDASALSKLVTMDSVTVLASSKRFESSLEDSRWGHGAFTKAFLDALTGAADIGDRGTIRMGDLAMAMDAEVENLTGGAQHLGPHLNFVRDEILIDNR
jgi:WD40 repeat protein